MRLLMGLNRSLSLVSANFIMELLNKLHSSADIFTTHLQILNRLCEITSREPGFRSHKCRVICHVSGGIEAAT